MRHCVKRLQSLFLSNPSLKKRNPQKTNRVLLGFYALFAWVLINATVMSLYFHDNDYEYAIFSHAYIEAILPNQPTTGPLRTGIVRIQEPSFNAFEAGDYVLTRDIGNELLGTGRNIPIVSLVLSKDETDETLQVSYDNVASATVTVDDVIGQYQRDARIIGSYYYSAMFPRGYILHMISHILLLLGYYYVFIYDTPVRFLPEKNPSKLSKKNK
ncbi:MAG: hypothetical protein ACOC14_01090 [Bacillota bacterium]